MFADPFRHSIDSPMTPAEVCFPVAPSDTIDLPTATKAIYIGEAGDVTLVSVRSETAVTFRNVAAGSILDVRVKAVKTTGTTAREIVGLA